MKSPGGYPGGGSTADPNYLLIRLTEFLAAMEDDLQPTGTLSAAKLQVGEPFELQSSPTMEATSSASIFDGVTVLAQGTASVIANPNTGTVDLTIELTEMGVIRTLVQTVSLSGSNDLAILGTLTIDDGGGQVTVLNGGWTYSTLNGAQIDPNSDIGFNGEVEIMLHATGGQRHLGFGRIAGIVGIVVSKAINFILDLFIPYTPPDSCTGPLIYDGTGQSCENVDIPCRNDLPNMCLSIDDIPNVSIAFKRCMKGRCGCGGSTFGREKMSCAEEQSCGPCGNCQPASDGCGGCSLLGSRMWYCTSASRPSCCINVIFHEMAHGCNALDLNDGSRGDARRIGNWFAQEFTNQSGGLGCNIVLSSK